MILVFGGTTEGKKVAALLEELAMPFVYSTKTKIAFETTQLAIYRHGAFDEIQLENYLKENEVEVIINAAHPFAEVLHQTIARVSEKLKISVLRLERQPLDSVENPLVSYVRSYDEALGLLKENNILLALTGVQSIEKLAPYWKNNTSYFRILDRPESIAIAAKSNFPEKQLILGMPSANLEEEIALIKKYHVDVLLTKETGDSGFLTIKIEAALQTNARIIIITKPKTPSYFKQVFSIEELQDLLTSAHYSLFITDNLKR